MSWNLEQAANDLERYVLRGELPAIGACKVLIDNARTERTCRNKGDQFVFVCSECGLNLELDCDEIGYGTPMVFREGKDVRKLDKPSYCPNCGARIIEDPN